MKFSLKKGIIYESFESKSMMMEKILLMINESKMDKIIYKGDKNDINYRTMKRILGDTNDTKKNPEQIKITYKTFITNHTQSYCLIYKEKEKRVVC